MPFGAAAAVWPSEHLAQAVVGRAVEDAALVLAVLLEAFDFLVLDRPGTVVDLDAVAVEHPHLDDRAGDARRQPQRGVAHVARLLAEDRAEQLFLRRHRAFALGRDLADEDVARVHFGADVDDARLVEVAQRFLADVGDVAGDVLRPELGVAGHDLEFLDVDRGEHVVLDDALGDQDRILVVVAVPRHERDEAVAAERQLAEIGRGAVGDDVAGLDHVADLHQRALVDAGVLVRALELLQLVDVDAGVAGIDFARSRARRCGWRRPGRPRPSAAPRSPRPNRAPRSLPCRCRRTAPRRGAAAPPGAACSSPSARGWRRRSRGTGSATRRPRRAAWG